MSKAYVFMTAMRVLLFTCLTTTCAICIDTMVIDRVFDVSFFGGLALICGVSAMYHLVRIVRDEEA
jgi:hypothetical protein